MDKGRTTNDERNIFVICHSSMQMFRKILIANRGEIAVRIARTCREMNIPTVALYEAADRGSLHVRLADESVLLDAPGGFMNGDAILRIAEDKGVDAIHPGYGFLAENVEFLRACESRSIAFIGPPSTVVELTAQKIDALKRVQAAGIPTSNFSSCCFASGNESAWNADASAVGYPLVVKPCLGGRGRGAHFVRRAEELDAAVQRAQQEAHTIYGDPRVYFEKAILPARQLGVQILADGHGGVIHLGEREGSMSVGNQKVIEESPAPALTVTERERLWQLALSIARLFEYRNAGTVEFLMDADGNLYFTEIKARIQIEHPLTEMLTRLDLVREQIRLATGEPLNRKQNEIRLDGWTMLARISAEDPENQMLPSPGRLQYVRLPDGAEVRTDTYVYAGCDVPSNYDPLIAKLIVWGQDREACRTRLERAVEEFTLAGTETTLPLVQQLVRETGFPHTGNEYGSLPMRIESKGAPLEFLRDLAAAIAIYQEYRTSVFQSTTPERMMGGWHRSSRTLPE